MSAYVAVSRPEEREAAAARQKEFRFRFPRDPRRLGGKYSVDENAAILTRFFYLEYRLAHALGSWTLAIPEMEVKIETGRHIFWHADAAKKFRERLTEQELNFKKVDAIRDAEIDLLIEELLLAENSAELMAGAHLVVGRALQTAYRHHIDDTCPIADAPTIRLMKQILMDYEGMLSWAEEAVAAYVEGGVDGAKINQWRWHLGRVLSAIGGVTGRDPKTAMPEGLRQKKGAYVRATVPLRDSRFTTFAQTGEYDVADGSPRHVHDSYEAKALDFVRTQRDELDAIEAFGTFLWDIRFKDFQAEYDLARITWDEARHTEIGHNTLQVMGYNPFELPNRLTSSTCRGPMEAEYAFTAINAFGEVAVLKTIHGLIDQARDNGDWVLAHASDFVRADERTHVRKGQTIIKHMTNMSWKDLEFKTRELFTECLVGLGAVKKGDGDWFTLSREDIERLVGE
ncbi:MAG: hypothetical protein V4498_10185 [candidate division FCPU426 bacterium]